jgi:threonine/homoserine efflux transporter RhtA
MPAPVLTVGSVLSVETSAAVATEVFAEAGPLGAVWLRSTFAAAALFVA